MMMARYPCPLPGSQTSHGELERLVAACDTGAEVGSNPEGGPTGKLAEDAAGPAAAGFLGNPFEPILCFL
jgi:hypothetical protein